MQTTQALTQLGLDEGATQAEVEQAYQQRSARISGRLDKAPSDTLKHKYQTILTQLAAAKALLLEPEIMNETTDNKANANSNAAPRSPLSATKLADLPGAGTSMGGAPDADELHAGQLLGNRYQIKGQIGAGGMGAVYHAFDQSKQENIAVKVLLPALVKDDRARSRFMDEARISAKLSHPGIVNVFDVQQDGDYLFLTMELLEGQDLRSLMETRKLSRQPFDEGEAKQLITALCTALSYAHKHTVHRDLKPENIWVTEEGEYKIMDFGIARVMSNSQRTQTGMAMGTAYYMAPEQLKGTAKVDGRADIYALGVLLYELLTGEVPAGRFKPLRELRNDLSKGFAAATDKTLEPDPDERFVGAESFAEATNRSDSLSFALPWKPIGIAAGLLVTLLGIGGLTSSGGLSVASLKGLLPMSQEEIAQNKAEAARLQGEIRIYKQRLESGRRQLASDLRDATRNNSKELNNLERWKTLTDNYLFEGNQITELEGELSMAVSLLHQESVEKAQQTLTTVRDGYQVLWRNFTSAERIQGVSKLVENERAAWLKIKRHDQLGDSVEAKTANAAWNLGQEQTLAGDFTDAEASFEKASVDYRVVTQLARTVASMRAEAAQTYQRWIKRKNHYGLSNPASVEQAEHREGFAKTGQREGRLSDAARAWHQAQQHWRSSYEVVTAEITQIDADRKAKATQERIAEQERIAAIAEAKAEKQRLAEVAVTEAKRQASAAKAKAKAQKKRFLEGHTYRINEINFRVRGVPAGSFQMGSNNGDSFSQNEPVHQVAVQSFFIQEHEVTFDLWDACVLAGGCSHKPDDEGWGRGKRPVVNVSYNNITQQFIPWVSQATGKRFRLPSEAEWEYAARAGSTTEYSWGNGWDCSLARHGYVTFDKRCGAQRSTDPVKSYSPNAFGLFDMHGNVEELAQDCWNDSYNGAPSNGRVWTSGDCTRRVLRGGSWYSWPFNMRSATRSPQSLYMSDERSGFRLVQVP